MATSSASSHQAPPSTEIKYPPSHASHHGSPKKPEGHGHYAELAQATGEERREKLKARKEVKVTLPHVQDPAVHYSVICDNCQNFVVGDRYKCG